MHWHSLQTLASWKGEVVHLMIKPPINKCYTTITLQWTKTEQRNTNLLITSFTTFFYQTDFSTRYKKKKICLKANGDVMNLLDLNAKKMAVLIILIGLDYLLIGIWFWN